MSVDRREIGNSEAVGGRRWTRRVGLGAGLALFYGSAFAALTYPRVQQFSTHYWADHGDGLENVWNLWWVRKAIVELHQSPWYTTYLHHPYGISLHAHALSPFNGLLGIPLSAFFGPVATHNAIVLFAFVASGLTAFWLAHAVTHSVAGSAVAGYVFAFSAFHFAHTGVHLNVISLQWLPLSLLYWLRLLDRPSRGAALGAALALFGVYLCDYYYFAYAVVALAFLAAGEARARSDWRCLWRGAHRGPLALFAALFTLTSGAMIAAAGRAFLESPFVGGHPSRALSLDLLAPFLPGGHSRFADYFRWYWRTAGGNINENSVFIGFAAVVLIAGAGLSRHGPGTPRLGRWYGLLALFTVLALGPRLHLFGWEVPALVLPYGWLEHLWIVRLGGVPLRAFAMVTLAAAVLCAAGVQRLVAAGGARRGLAAALFALMVIETAPGSIPASAPPLRSFARHLAAQPGTSAVIEVTEPALPLGVALYYQTIHEKPMAFGHTSRETRAAQAGSRRLRDLIRAGDYASLHCAYGFRYVLADEGLALDAPSEPVDLWEPGRRGRVYDLQRRFGPCRGP